MATKFTTNRQLVVGSRKTDHNNVLQLLRKSAIVGSFEALRRATLMVVSLVLTSGVSVTIATQLKQTSHDSVTPIADGEV